MQGSHANFGPLWLCLVEIKSHISHVNKTIFIKSLNSICTSRFNEWTQEWGIVLFDRKSPIRLKLNPKKFNGPKHNHQSQFNFLCQKKLNLCFHYFIDRRIARENYMYNKKHTKLQPSEVAVFAMGLLKCISDSGVKGVWKWWKFWMSNFQVYFYGLKYFGREFFQGW